VSIVSMSIATTGDSVVVGTFEGIPVGRFGDEEGVIVESLGGLASCGVLAALLVGD